jgi:nitroreductase
MIVKDLVKKNRSYRRFYENHFVSYDVLKQLIDLARLSASAGNAQPLKYILSCTKDKNDRIFPTLAWAAYYKDWSGPEEGEKPSAYIVMLCDTDIATNFYCDHGIAAQSILLGAVEKGLGGCIIANIKKEALRQVLKIPGKYEILQVLALGKPKEEVVIESLKKEKDIKYWRDSAQVHHVPKRALEDIILLL